MNWGLKRTFFRSSYKSSTLLRQSKKILGISQTIDLKSLLYFYNYIKGEKLAFQENLKLPNALFHINSRTKKVIFQDHISSAILHKSFFRSTSMKWNSLPSQIRKFSLSKKTIIWIKVIFVQKYKPSRSSSPKYMERFPFHLVFIYLFNIAVFYSLFLAKCTLLHYV